MDLFTKKLIKSKKGGMELSINSIVILILAITMLGLGLTFVRGMFGGATGKLGKVVETTSLKEPASAEKPLTIDNTITMKQGKSIETEIGFYNKYPVPLKDVFPYMISCYESGKTEEATVVPKLTTPARGGVGAGVGAGYAAIMDISGTQHETIYTVGKTFICSLGIQATGDANVGATPWEETQFFLKISS